MNSVMHSRLRGSPIARVGRVSRVTRSRIVALSALLSALFSIALLFTSSRAFAAGTFTIDQKEISENKKSKPTGDPDDDEFDKNGEWTMKVTIGLPSMPPTNQLVMRFAFTKTVIYDRVFMKEGETPSVQVRSLAAGMQHNEDVAVPFSYLGKPVQKTKFEFDLKRAAGFFEAGEYEVKLMGPDGQIGQQMTIKLKGINKKDYRGTVGFETKVKSGLDGGTKTAKNDTPSDDTPKTSPTSTDVAAVGNGGSMFGSGDKTPEEEIKEHPKGCGCTVPGTESGAIVFAGPVFTLFALGFAGVRRARRRRS